MSYNIIEGLPVPGKMITRAQVLMKGALRSDVESFSNIEIMPDILWTDNINVQSFDAGGGVQLVTPSTTELPELTGTFGFSNFPVYWVGAKLDIRAQAYEFMMEHGQDIVELDKKFYDLSGVQDVKKRNELFQKLSTDPTYMQVQQFKVMQPFQMFDIHVKSTERNLHSYFLYGRGLKDDIVPTGGFLVNSSVDVLPSPTNGGTADMTTWNNVQQVISAFEYMINEAQTSVIDRVLYPNTMAIPAQLYNYLNGLINQLGTASALKLINDGNGSMYLDINNNMSPMKLCAYDPRYLASIPTQGGTSNALKDTFPNGGRIAMYYRDLTDEQNNPFFAATSGELELKNGLRQANGLVYSIPCYLAFSNIIAVPKLVKYFDGCVTY